MSLLFLLFVFPGIAMSVSGKHPVIRPDIGVIVNINLPGTIQPSFQGDDRRVSVVWPPRDRR